MQAMISTAELNKNFQMGEIEIQVLRDINLEIAKGEFASIMGPSGSGKSTLLYLLGGLDKPTSGSIKVNGKELAVMEDKAQSVMRRKEVGFVFQFYNLVPNLNVEENVMLPLLLDGKKMKANREKVEEILETVDLLDRKTHTPRELSGGQDRKSVV